MAWTFVPFLTAVTKYLTNIGGLILAQSLRVWSVIMGKAWWLESIFLLSTQSGKHIHTQPMEQLCPISGWLFPQSQLSGNAPSDISRDVSPR